jgi:hypothetical protein
VYRNGAIVHLSTEVLVLWYIECYQTLDDAKYFLTWPLKPRKMSSDVLTVSVAETCHFHPVQVPTSYFPSYGSGSIPNN